MITVSAEYVVWGVAVIVVLGICLIGLLRSAGDRYANRLQELLELIEETPELRRVGNVRRKAGRYRLDIYGASFEGSCSYDPKRGIMSYSNKLMDVTHVIRKGRKQADVEMFFASLNIHDVPSTTSGPSITAAEETTSSDVEAS